MSEVKALKPCTSCETPLTTANTTYNGIQDTGDWNTHDLSLHTCNNCHSTVAMKVPKKPKVPKEPVEKTADSELELLEKKCPRCGGASASKGNPSGRCSACLKKLATNKKKPGHYLHNHKVADDALRRQKGKNGTASKKTSGLGSRKDIIKKVKAGEKKAGTVLSPDRIDNKKGYSSSNTRMVPKELNRGRHHVDEKKLRNWKKKLKKSELDTASLYTLMKAKYHDNEEILGLLKSVGPEGLEQYIHLFDTESTMEKGAMKRLAPITAADTARVEPHQGPISHIQEGGQSGQINRERLPRLEGPYRTRGIHKLSSMTSSRVNAETKEREFLLHRGMSPKEAQGHTSPKGILNRTSWTPSLEVAQRSATDDNTHLSAWVPEQHIHHILSAIPKYKNRDDFRDEHEIIVAPHKMNIKEGLQKSAAKKLEAPQAPSLEAHVGKTHTVEIHPDIDHMYRAKGLIKENNRPHLHIGDFKKHGFPTDIVKKLPRDARGKVTPEMIDKHIEGLPKHKVNVSLHPYEMAAQQHRPGQQYALTVNMHPESQLKMQHEHKKLWNKIKGSQHDVAEGHSSSENNQIGWSRIDPSKDDHWHVDEIQSDFQNKNKIEDKRPAKKSLDLMSPDLQDRFWKESRTQHLEDWLANKANEDHPKHKELKEQQAQVEKHLSNSKDELKELEEYHYDPSDLDGSNKKTEMKNKRHKEILQPLKDLNDRATEHGILHPKEDVQKYIDMHNENIADSGEHASGLHSHLSHGHEDPQHMIHSATNALARKLDVKSMSMDTPQDQAEQSNLTGDGDYDHNDYNYEYDDESSVRDIRKHIEDNFSKEHFDDAVKNHPNKYLKNVLNNLGYEKLKEAISSSMHHYEPTEGIHENLMGDEAYDKLSGPEKDALTEYVGVISDGRPDPENYRVRIEAEGDRIPEASDGKVKVPVHQLDTYKKRPRKLGMKEVDKKSLLGEHENDDATHVQYMNLHKKLTELLDTLSKGIPSAKQFPDAYTIARDPSNPPGYTGADAKKARVHAIKHVMSTKITPIKSMLNAETGKQEPHVLIHRGLDGRIKSKDIKPNDIKVGKDTIEQPHNAVHTLSHKVASKYGKRHSFWVPASNVIAMRHYVNARYKDPSQPIPPHVRFMFGKESDDNIRKFLSTDPSHAQEHHILVKPGTYTRHLEDPALLDTAKPKANGLKNQVKNLRSLQT